MSKDRKRRGPRAAANAALGLDAFERISAVEGVRLTDEMRRDLLAFEREQIGAQERTRFIAEKYGCEPSC
ncbi:hypothetical protein [Methylorubrum sp. SB2]|uniref:hypothetical protein n=1 Tax=Methylorubrum subtropicum TaxID=3138812 RepID=UPI00313BE64D